MSLTTTATPRQRKRRRRYGPRQRERAAALVAQNENYAHRLVRNVLGFTCSESEEYLDAVQVARIAMYRAALAYDAGRGVKFRTFATTPIKRDLWRMARVHSRYGFTHTSDSPHLRERNIALPTLPTSLDGPPDRAAAGEISCLHEEIADRFADCPAMLAAHRIDAAELWRLAFGALTDRQFKVLRYRFHDALGYPAIAERIGTTRRRAQQVAEWATVRLRRAIERRRVGGGKEGVDE